MKPRGRPPLDPSDPSIDVHFRVPSKAYEAACRQAETERLTLAQWLRRNLVKINRPVPPKG